MYTLKEKVLASLLSLSLISSLFGGFTPTVQAAESDLSNVKIYAEKEQSEIKTAGITKVVDGSKQQWDIELWHFSGNYWANKTVYIKDKDWEKTAGGVADLHSALTLDKQTFTYDIAKGSDLEKAINEGKEVYINLSSGNKAVKLSSLYEMQSKTNNSSETEEFLTNSDGTLLAKDATAKIVKENGQYKIQVSVKPKLNYYTEKELSYTRTYGIALNKWVPFVANGFGYQVYSIWGGGFSAGYALGWVNQQDPYSLEGMPEGRIHPSFITSPDGHMEKGHTIKVDTKKVDASTVRIGDYTFRDAGAVGMKFCFPINVDIYVEGAAPQVVTSYVKLDGVNPDGTPRYKQIKTETTNAELTEMGTVRVDEIKILDEGTGYINDVFTSPINLSDDVKNLDWTDDLPKTTTTKIEATADDIWSYNLSIRMGMLYQIEDVVVNTETEEYSYLTKLRAKYDALWEQYQAEKDFVKREAIWKEILKVLSELTSYVNSQSALRQANSTAILQGSLRSIAVDDSMVEKIVNTSIYLGNLDNVFLYPLDERPQNHTLTETVEINQKASANGLTVDSKVTVGDDTEVAAEDATTTLYLRYIVIPERKVREFIHTYKDGELINTEVNTKSLPVIESDGVYEEKVNIPVVEGADLIKWGTSKDIPLLPQMPSKPEKEGTTLDPVILDADENLYVEWKRVIPGPADPVEVKVDQWRLSKYVENLGWRNQGHMNLNLTPDEGHAYSSLSPSGTYSYKTINPNNQYTDTGYNPTNQQYNDYLHSKTLTKGVYSVTHGEPSAAVDLTGSVNLIKGTSTFGLNAAGWQTQGAVKEGLSVHNIKTSNLPTVYTGLEQTNKNDLLKFGFENSSIYNHNYGVYNHYTCHHYEHEGCHDVCACYTLPEVRSPKSGVSYTTADYKLNSTFNRYIATPSDKLTVTPKTTVDNGKTSISYQSGTELKVYPEVAMLFDNDKGDTSIKWVVGEQARKINPVVYHTLQFKVWVNENSNATPYATDSRAITNARKMGEADKQVAYKGGPVNTSFGITKGSKSKEKGLLTVKTFALDISNNKNGIDVKQAWGANNYNSQKLHTDFLGKWSFKGTAIEKLEIASTPLYTGAEKRNPVNLTEKTYAGKTIIEFTHELIVRGGVVIGVKLQNREDGSYSAVAIDSLKTVDAALYEALVEMKLVGVKENTVFKGFETQTGAALTEEKFIDLVEKEKFKLDGLKTSNITLNKGWYSEDTTVLLVKEYVTNYEVPSISFSDKISLSVPGLETPVNKNEFFNKMAKGHTYLKMTFESSSLNALASGLKETNVFFERTSREASQFGRKTTDYLVPNVSAVDITSGF